MKKVLIIGHGIPEPQSTGAGVYMAQLIDLFLQGNHELHFCSAAETPIDGLLIEKIIPYTQIQLNSDSFDAFIKALDPQIVIFDRFMTEEQYSWRVREACPDALRILDTEDLHFLREHRRTSNDFKPPTVLSDLAKRELAAIFRSDLSLILSKPEFDLLSSAYQVPESTLLHLPFLEKNIPQLTELTAHKDREDFCFVGTAKHKPNVAAIKHLAKLWPAISKRVPGVKMHIYGSYFTEELKQLHKPNAGFLVHGFVKDVQTTLQQHRVLLAPLEFGAGLKRKLFDAWLAGCAVVTTPVGIEGIGGANELAFIVADDLETDFVNLAVSNCAQKSQWDQNRKEGLALICEYFSWEQRASAVLKTIESYALKKEEFNAQNPVGQMLWHHSLQSSKYLSKWIEAKNR
ncbi:glycosyltransferase family 4 protein [Gilvibacter sediminis]|uniref:glycosyltransferase family 4 protein n=1 Tax=Gilvibacter sediminis TaxID=379071 RepID=UPI0023505139|nr:glycosyltransferase family 4 protein [Gilvibacter sediminis]MDC7998820.1 glycosyltransferase family 4 protein [Gilvibacter sediminis]